MYFKYAFCPDSPRISRCAQVLYEFCSRFVASYFIRTNRSQRLVLNDLQQISI